MTTFNQHPGSGVDHHFYGNPYFSLRQGDKRWIVKGRDTNEATKKARDSALDAACMRPEKGPVQVSYRGTLIGTADVDGWHDGEGQAISKDKPRWRTNARRAAQERILRPREEGCCAECSKPLTIRDGILLCRLCTDHPMGTR